LWLSLHTGTVSERIFSAHGGQFSPLVTEVYPLADYQETFASISERRAKGKVILSIWYPSTIYLEPISYRINRSTAQFDSAHRRFLSAQMPD
jgi:hypothetical protein